MTNKLIKSLWNFIERPLLATVILIPPVIGIREYNLGNSTEQEMFNFSYKGMEAKVVNIDYSITGNLNHILLEDGGIINQGNIISDDRDIVRINNGYYFINGVEQK